MLKVEPVPIYQDNYVWMILEPHGKQAWAVDPGDAGPVQRFAAQNKLTLAGILITHSHWDHVSGIDELVHALDVPVYGPKTPSIPQITHPVSEGDRFMLWNASVQVMEVPGHMPEHLCYLAAHNNVNQLFCGDVLFSAGCGRIFSGTPAELKHSLDRLRQLPSDTLVYCAHEYTLANIAFAKTVEPANKALAERELEVLESRHSGIPSLPTSVGAERQFNPFLRYDHPEVVKSISKKVNNAPPDMLTAFTWLRQWKDEF